MLTFANDLVDYEHKYEFPGFKYQCQMHANLQSRLTSFFKEYELIRLNTTEIGHQSYDQTYFLVLVFFLSTLRFPLFSLFDNSVILYRSMGILLPPVSQVTNTRINLTQHHRNRSLDSALQRIPEVIMQTIDSHIQSDSKISILFLKCGHRLKYHHRMPSQKIFCAQTQFWVRQCAAK